MRLWYGVIISHWCTRDYAVLVGVPSFCHTTQRFFDMFRCALPMMAMAQSCLAASPGPPLRKADLAFLHLNVQHWPPVGQPSPWLNLLTSLLFSKPQGGLGFLLSPVVFPSSRGAGSTQLGGGGAAFFPTSNHQQVSQQVPIPRSAKIKVWSARIFFGNGAQIHQRLCSF